MRVSKTMEVKGIIPGVVVLVELACKAWARLTDPD